MATSQDWQCDKSLTECLEHMLKSNIATDVTFVVGRERKVIHAHKLILISRSPVFYAMLEGPMSEKGEITIPDIQKNTFELFLRYLYTDNIELDIHNVISVLAAARKYCVDKLMNRCERFIKDNLKLEYAGVLLEEAHIFMEEKTKKDCLQHIWDDPEEFLKSKNFGHLCRDCVKSITESDELAVEERQVYEAVIRWSEDECDRQEKEVTDENRRNVLGDILYTVRFPLLSKDYFTDVVSITELLTSEEISSVLRLKLGKGKVLSQNIVAKKRKDDKKPRRVLRFRQIHHDCWNPKGRHDVLAFKVSKNVIMHGICICKTDGISGKNFLLSIYASNGEQLFNTHSKNTASSRDDSIVDLLFNEELHLNHSQVYLLAVHNTKNLQCYGSNGIDSVTMNSIDVSFLNANYYGNFSFARYNDNYIKGPIAGLLLSGLK